MGFALRGAPRNLDGALSIPFCRKISAGVGFDKPAGIGKVDPKTCQAGP